MKQRVFVFGSNLIGYHGAGSAKEAHRNHGAQWGVGSGPTGNAYAIPTKDGVYRTLPLDRIMRHVGDFRDYAEAHPECEFAVVEIGCGLAGYTPKDIAPLFHSMPPNVKLPLSFQKVLGNA